VALASWIALNCEDGGRIDLRCDEKGVPNFIEVNPLAGMNPVYSDLPMLSRMNGIPYNELIKRIMDSAFQKTVLHE
jgi:D-alanine-D-alanine ligase